MRPPTVVPLDPTVHGFSSMVKIAEVVLPGTLFLEATEKAFDQSVLLGRIGRYELLRQAIGAAGPTEPFALEDQAVITADDRAILGDTKRAESLETRFFQSPLGFLGSATEGELVPKDLAVVAVDDSTEMAPAIDAAGDVCDVHCPTNIALLGLASPGFRPGSGCFGPLVHEPIFDLHDPVDRLSIDLYPLEEAKDRPDPPVAESGMLIDDFLDPVCEFKIDE